VHVDVSGWELVLGSVVPWVIAKARRVAGHADTEVDRVIDAVAERAHELIDARLGADPAWVKLHEEAETEGEVSERTLQRVELAIADVADADETFANQIHEVLAVLAERGRPGPTASASTGAVAIGGDAIADVNADNGGVAAQFLGSVTVHPPSSPGQGRA
jgi:hypothetical protein